MLRDVFLSDTRESLDCDFCDIHKEGRGVGVIGSTEISIMWFRKKFLHGTKFISS